jgi:Ca2+-binding RTX toxin-like protein
VEENVVGVSLEGGPFEPGFTDEPGDSDEIEFVVGSDLIPLDGSQLRLVVQGTSGPDHLVSGFEGVNLNPDETDGVDPDVSTREAALEGGGGADLLEGGGFGTGDTVYGLGLDGGEGEDELRGGRGGDQLRGGPGADRLHGGDGGDGLWGGPGNDELTGGEGSQDGGDGLAGGPGTDTLDGGPSSSRPDLAMYRDTAGPATVDLAAGLALDDGDGGVDVIGDVEGIQGGQYAERFFGDAGPNMLDGAGGDDLLHGRGGGDQVWGWDGADEVDLGEGNDWTDAGEGDDVLRGGSEDDHLVGGGGDDAFDGGSGTDLARIADLRSVDAFLAEDRAVFRDGSGQEPLLEVEDLVGGYREDLLVGDSGDNLISGGDDSYPDLIRGGPGDDNLAASGTGFYGGGDIVDYSQVPGPVEIADRRATQDGDGSVDVVGGTSVRGSRFNDRIQHRGRIEGLEGDDVLSGSTDEDQIDGGSGIDTLSGDLGNDELTGGPGADTMRGGGGAPYGSGDTVVYSQAETGVTVDLAVGVAAADGHGSADTVSEFERLTGSPYADRLTGGEVSEFIDGGDGNDVIAGGSGSDELLTGQGDDTAAGGDGEDRIRSGSGFDAYDGGAGIDRFEAGYSLPSGISVDLTAKKIEDDGYGEREELTGVEDVVGTEKRDILIGDAGPNAFESGYGGDLLRGLGGADSLTAEGGSARLEGAEGGDTLAARGPATMVGGPGDDQLFIWGAGILADYSEDPAAIDADLPAGRVRDGYGATDTLSLPAAVRGSAYADVVVGSSWPDRLIGGDGGDTLRGGDGDDEIDGGGGSDEISGNADADRLEGGPGQDNVTGQDGADRLALRDGEQDAGTCGEGTDTAVADVEGVDAVDPDCETVERAGPEPSPEPEPDPAPGPDPGPNPDPGADPAPDPGPSPDPAPDPAPEPGPEPAPDPESDPPPSEGPFATNPIPGESSPDLAWPGPPPSGWTEAVPGSNPIAGGDEEGQRVLRGVRVREGRRPRLFIRLRWAAILVVRLRQRVEGGCQSRVCGRYVAVGVAKRRATRHLVSLAVPHRRGAPLRSGTYRVTVLATDDAGVRSRASVRFVHGR